MKKAKLQKRQYIMFIAGLLALVMGFNVLSFLVIRKIHRDIKRNTLMRENVVIEIPDLNIKAPVLEGTDDEILSMAAGHFSGTGTVDSGNYCIAGHSSTIYKEYFNSLKNVKADMELRLYDTSKNVYTYYVTDYFIVDPNEMWVLNDFRDNRVTLITCTDDGSQRLVVVAKKDAN